MRCFFAQAASTGRAFRTINSGNLRRGRTDECRARRTSAVDAIWGGEFYGLLREYGEEVCVEVILNCGDRDGDLAAAWWEHGFVLCGLAEHHTRALDVERVATQSSDDGSIDVVSTCCTFVTGEHAKNRA